MPSERRTPSEGSARSAHSSGSRRERASDSMGLDGGEAGRRIAAEDEYIRRELSETTAFCNAFWGSGDAGYDVIQGRMKGAQRTLEDLKAIYKERADIEAEYSKRLAKLSKQALGRDETGALRAALDTVKAELEATSRTHLDLANMVRKDLEGNVHDFLNRSLAARKNSQASIEKLHKNKQTQEQYVNKSKEKYEQDCIKINGYTAQSSLVQGRDLDKVAYKLDKAQATVAQNDKDYQNFVRALKDTTVKWNAEWKSYLDQCQDLEEERIDFIKANLWNYANAVSAVCVADDESCERVRVSLETVETPRDIQFYIQHCGTGSLIPAPPEYINYAKGQAPPPRPQYHTARFQRNTTRPVQLPISNPPPAAQAAPPAAALEHTMQNVAPAAKPTPAAPGDDSGASQFPATYRGPPAAASQQNGGRENGYAANGQSSPSKPPPGAVPLPGMAGGQVPPPQQQQQSEMRPSPSTEKRMSARNFLARTSSLSHSSSPKAQPPKPLGEAAQQSNNLTTSESAGSNAAGVNGDDEEDPIAKALASLRMRPGARSPGPQSARSQAATQPALYQQSPGPQPGQPFGPQPGQYQPHQPSQPPIQRAASPSVSQGFPQRARSPSAAFMQAPQRAASPLPVEDVVGQYGQAFPGERKSLSRQNSSASRVSMQPSPSAPVTGLMRSPTKGDQGFAGVGARGRSPSPQPYARQQQSSQAAPAAPPAEDPRRRTQPPPRSTTPLGIALDATGSVTHDEMAEEYMRRSGSVPPVQAQPGVSYPGQMQPQRPPSAAGGSIAQSGYHQSQPSMHQQQPTYGGAPGSGMANRRPSIQQAQYSSSYAPSVAPSHQSYPSQQSVQHPPAGAQQAPVYGHYGAAPPPQHQQAPMDPRAYGGNSPSPYGRPASMHAPAASQSLPAHLAQQPYGASPHMGMANAAPPAGPPQHQQQQPSSYYGQQGPPPAPPVVQQETPAAAYMHQYQQQHGLQSGSTATAPGVGGHAQQPTNASAYQQQHPQQQAPPPPQSQHLQQQSSWSVAGGMRAQSPAPSHHAPHQAAMQQPHQQQPPPPVQMQQQQQQQPPPPQPQQSQPQPQGQPHPPTGQFSDSGRPILFYVKALYDYTATMDEEFSFTAGDIIAVTHTEADGWWQGELLDEARRRPGANTFPSNFVQLLM